MKTRNAGLSPEYARISRNFAEYHGISWFMSNVALCFVYFSLTGTVSTSPNLAKARAPRASNDCRATRSLFSSLAKFGEADTVPVSEKCDNPRMT